MSGIYKEMYDAGWRLINGSWANPDEVEKFEKEGAHDLTD